MLAALVVVFAMGCAGPQKVDPTAARAAVYSTDFGTLFQEVAVVVKGEYPNLAAKPNERVVKTAWHQLPFTESVEGKDETLRYDGNNTSSLGDSNDNFDRRRAFRRDNTTREMKHFVRFDVSIQAVGSPAANQWKVVVTGQASEHDGTGVPVELTGAARPYWLDGRISKLEVKIHERVKRLSVASR